MNCRIYIHMYYINQHHNFETISSNALDAGEFWKACVKFWPFSAAMARLGSIGISPKNGTDTCSANA